MLAAPLRTMKVVSCVVDASLSRFLAVCPSDLTDDCSDGVSRLVPAALDGVAGDVQGLVEVCEEQRWKKVVHCGGDDLWTTANTEVACREHGYAAAGQHVKQQKW